MTGQDVRHHATTAGGIVIKDLNGRLLIGMAHDPEKGEDAWILPKGHVRAGETLRETALREIEEEIGVEDAQLIQYLGCVTRLSLEDWGEIVDKDIHYFLAYAPGTPDIRPVAFETVVESGWFSLEDAIERIPWPEEREFLADQLAAMVYIL